MTTATFSAAPSNASDAEFRAWGSGLSAALAAVGLVKTADTGQINWGTVLKPAGASTFQGYEIWRFNDSLQATAPVFLKVEFGSSGSVGNPAVRVTVGKGSDGAGTITGIIHAALVIPTAAASATPVTWYVSSGDGSGVAVVPALSYYAGATVSGHWWAVERSRDASGNATGTCVAQQYRPGGTAFSSVRCANYATAAALLRVGAPTPAVVPANTASDISLAVGGTAPLFPALFSDGAANYWQAKTVLVGMRQDVGTGTPFNVPGWGNYLPLGVVGQGADSDQGAYATTCLWWY